MRGTCLREAALVLGSSRHSMGDSGFLLTVSRNVIPSHGEEGVEGVYEDVLNT